MGEHVSAGRLNIDVTATTGQFAAQMKRVRSEMATTVRAAGKGFSLGGMGAIGGPLGAIGQSVGVLSGPMAALAGSIAGLTIAMKAQERFMQAGRENLSEMRLLGMGLDEQANAKRLATIIRPDGTGADAVGLADKFAEFAPEFGLGTMRGLSLPEKLERAMIAAKGPDALRLAELMGGKAGEDFMRLRMLDPSLLMSTESKSRDEPQNAVQRLRDQMGLSRFAPDGSRILDAIDIAMGAGTPTFDPSLTSGVAASAAAEEERIRARQAAEADPNDPSIIRDFVNAIERFLGGWFAAKEAEAASRGLDSSTPTLDQLRQMNNGLRAAGPGI